MKFTIAILVNNQFGVLNRVINKNGNGKFHGINLRSLQ